MNLTVDSNSPVHKRADGEARPAERAAVDAQPHPVAVKDADHVENATGARGIPLTQRSRIVDHCSHAC
ncbi:hypothetical protein [Streptomyces tendae]|uniref:hypothetical protein n=1 Tax=Streptomyces tendae TaxID=1932 RepID=UPI003714B38B